MIEVLYIIDGRLNANLEESQDRPLAHYMPSVWAFPDG
jgi:hypothetical protein